MAPREAKLFFRVLWPPPTWLLGSSTGCEGGKRKNAKREKMEGRKRWQEGGMDRWRWRKRAEC